MKTGTFSSVVAFAGIFHGSVVNRSDERLDRIEQDLHQGIDAPRPQNLLKPIEARVVVSEHEEVDPARGQCGRDSVDGQKEGEVASKALAHCFLLGPA